MPRSALHSPKLDPTSIFELFRGSYGSELLTAAVAHFDLFNQLADGPKPEADVRESLALESRPWIVLLTAMRAMGLIATSGNEIKLTPLAQDHLCRNAEFNVSDYVGLAAESPGVLAMVERLRSNRPFGSDDDGEGTAFIYRDGKRSAMEQTEAARHFTLSLAGRAKNVAPILAERVDLLGTTRILDLGGGTGIYSIALLQKHPNLNAVVLDRPEVLKVAEEFAREYGVSERLELLASDMFADPLPNDCDSILLSNILHDWDQAECQQLIARCAESLPDRGKILIHDVFLNDTLDGPLAIALYSAALFTLTEGRAYSAAEYREWLSSVGLTSGPITATGIHCGVICGTKGS